MIETTTTDVRGIEMTLAGYTRALRLCARMNRETEVLDFIDAIPDGSVFYDLGACEGRFAIYAALRGVRAYAFEPEEMNFRTLSENVALNGHFAAANLVAIRAAVGERDETTSLMIGQPWAGGHHRVVETNAGRIDLRFDAPLRQTVQVVALDSYIRDNGLPQPQFMKVDVDGSEMAFVRGAARSIAHVDLQRVIFELCRQDPATAGILKVLRDAGFAVVAEHQVEPDLFNVVFERR